MSDIRRSALSVLDQIEKDNAYSNIVLDNLFNKEKLGNIDARFIRALVFGVIERKITLDYILNGFIKSGIEKQPVTVINNLRMALYQIMFMDKVPSHAAVNEAVRLIKNSKYKRLAPFTNAVLRNVLRNDISLPKGDDINSLSVRYSCEKEVIKVLIDSIGLGETVSFLENSLKTPPLFLKVNTLKTDSDNLIIRLKEENIIADKCELNDALVIKSGSDIIGSKAFCDGLFHIEDIACQTALSYLAPKQNERVLDTCAAPGGKTFSMAEIMANKGEIVACDIYSSRLSLITSGAKRLGIDIIKVKENNSEEFSSMGLFDAVLCDVPCSGIGVIRRKPEIKYKKLDDIKTLIQTQKNILDNADRYLKPAGRLMYSTCTLNCQENEDVIKHFLDNHSNYKLVSERTFLPQKDNSDGFYCAVLHKAGE
ncbi:MAG: 16S rRNA (cytosine(967)-C(5))-methyltransferase RsmB [Clostridia bacterium]|nr:16S rRNA (cytosine(967)-C(5))-methyltransferase RsmB [Clostridia bacterium]